MIKKILKVVLPNFIIKFLKSLYTSLKLLKFTKMTNRQIFSEIYKKKLWSPEKEKKNFEFYSGSGSHYKEFQDIYIDEIRKFLLTFSSKPDVVDLGCGDFTIGSKVRQYCKNYIAVDIFEDLIKDNKKRYSNLNVDFKVLDITKEELPAGNICFLRQVLQHFSNNNIQNFLKQIDGKYKYLVLTEHLPNNSFFKPNIDIATGPQIRLYKNSGVILTERPFNLKVIDTKNICNISSKQILGFEGVLNTKIYHLNK